jgi:hypothetical protein
LERGLACKQAALVWKLPHFAPEVELKWCHLPNILST